MPEQTKYSAVAIPISEKDFTDKQDGKCTDVLHLDGKPVQVISVTTDSPERIRETIRNDQRVRMAGVEIIIISDPTKVAGIIKICKIQLGKMGN